METTGAFLLYNSINKGLPCEAGKVSTEGANTPLKEHRRCELSGGGRGREKERGVEERRKGSCNERTLRVWRRSRNVMGGGSKKSGIGLELGGKDYGKGGREEG